MLAASRTTNEVPFITRFLSQDDRWHIMNIVINRISSLFGPFHIFFNEARRSKSYYRSAWYLYSITCQQNIHHGRFFVTPYKPVLSRVDMGVKRLRVDLVNETEMREIASGSIAPPAWGFFNNRHKYRWEILMKMSELFENQLVIIDKNDVSPSSRPISRVSSLANQGLLFEDGHELDSRSEDEDDSGECVGDEISPKSPHSWESVRNENSSSSRMWSPPRIQSPDRHTSNPREQAREAVRCGRKSNKKRARDIDNCIMRVHIPFPTADASASEPESKDVVLFE